MLFDDSGERLSRFLVPGQKFVRIHVDSDGLDCHALTMHLFNDPVKSRNHRPKIADPLSLLLAPSEGNFGSRGELRKPWFSNLECKARASLTVQRGYHGEAHPQSVRSLEKIQCAVENGRRTVPCRDTKL